MPWLGWVIGLKAYCEGRFFHRLHHGESIPYGLQGLIFVSPTGLTMKRAYLQGCGHGSLRVGMISTRSCAFYYIASPHVVKEMQISWNRDHYLGAYLRQDLEVSLRSLSFSFMYFMAFSFMYFMEEGCIVRMNFALSFNYFTISISTLLLPSPPMVVNI